MHPFCFQKFTVLFSIDEKYLRYFILPYCFVNFEPNYIIQRYNFIFFLQNITITVTSDGQVIKNNSPACFVNFRLMLCYFIIHSLGSSHFQVSSSKNSVIFNNLFIFLAFTIFISNHLVGFLCRLLPSITVSYSILSLFWWSFLLCLHIHIFDLFCYQFCLI